MSPASFSCPAHAHTHDLPIPPNAADIVAAAAVPAAASTLPLGLARVGCVRGRSFSTKAFLSYISVLGSILYLLHLRFFSVDTTACRLQALWRKTTACHPPTIPSSNHTTTRLTIADHFMGAFIPPQSLHLISAFRFQHANSLHHYPIISVVNTTACQHDGISFAHLQAKNTRTHETYPPFPTLPT